MVYTFPFCGHEYRCKTLIQQLTTTQSKHIQIVSPTSWPGLDEFVAHVSKFIRAGETVIIVHAETLLDTNTHYWLQKILESQTEHQATIIWMAEAMPFQLQGLPTKALASLTTYQFWLPQLTLGETGDFIAYLERMLEMNNTFLIQEIHQETGGHLWLTKEIMRQQKHADLTLKEIATTSAYKAKSELLYQSFPQELKEVVMALAQQKAVSHPHILDQATSLRMIHEDASLPGYIKRCAASNQLHEFKTHNNRLLLNQVNVTGMFSNPEQQALTLLLNNGSSPLSRDNLAAAFWPEADYTDWALDRAMFRLKKKLTKLGLPDTYITTIRGVGYKVAYL